jgi:hypothetical protein
MAVTILRKLKNHHERERIRKNAEYGGTWNGRKYGGWPRGQISDWVFPSRTNPANSMANFFAKEDAVMRALAKVKDFDPHDLRRTASTWANATCPSPWVDRLLDHEIGGVAGTYNLYAYVEHKRYKHQATQSRCRAGAVPLIMCTAFRGRSEAYPNLTIKKNPKAVLARGEWGGDDYSLGVANLGPAPPKPGQQGFGLED